MEAQIKPRVDLFTDGACSGNPGPGGWGFLMRHPASGSEIERSGAERATTNNRMELTAVIEGLNALTMPAIVGLYSDSKYVLDGMSEWMDSWIARGWKTADKKPVRNVELWQQLDTLRKVHSISFHWVRGHDGNEENERVDKLAVAAREALTAAR